jgi:hypothetical protein
MEVEATDFLVDLADVNRTEDKLVSLLDHRG